MVNTRDEKMSTYTEGQVIKRGSSINYPYAQDVPCGTIGKIVRMYTGYDNRFHHNIVWCYRDAPHHTEVFFYTEELMAADDYDIAEYAVWIMKR